MYTCPDSGLLSGAIPGFVARASNLICDTETNIMYISRQSTSGATPADLRLVSTVGQQFLICLQK